MQLHASLVASTILPLLSLAAPRYPAWSSITPQKILDIAPKSASCANATYQDECRTANQAAPYIAASFQQYGIASVGEQAALVSLMAFESGDFQYNKNHFPKPGRPGQGTRNMQSAQFNLQYAASIPALAPQVANLTGGAGAAANATALPPDTLNAIRELVLPDRYSFASAAWFLTSQCSCDFQRGLKTGGLDGWKKYIEKCVSTEVTPERQASWEKAVEALKPEVGGK